MQTRYGDEPAAVKPAYGAAPEHLEDGDTLTLVIAQKSVMSHGFLPAQWDDRYSNVEVETTRGSVLLRRGPVLALWPSAQGLAKILDNRPSVTALCVASWNEVELAPWIAAARPELLASAGEWAEVEAVALHPDVESALVSITATLNHNNTISAGFEKRVVVRALLRLHDAGRRLDGRELEGWALAHGWSRKNPSLLATYADDIESGKRPRTL